MNDIADHHEDTAWMVYESPLGPLTLVGGPAGLRGLRFPGRGEPLDEIGHDPDAFADPIEQLEEYFAGSRRTFELALDLRGTAFQQRVWDELRAIPHGATRTYGSIAESIGRFDRVRAVGGAVGATPVPIIVPCHRVIGANGDLTGYGGGLHRKAALLDLEAAVSAGAPAPAAWRDRQLALL